MPQELCHYLLSTRITYRQAPWLWTLRLQLWPSQLHCKNYFTHQAVSPTPSFLSCFLLPRSLDVSSLVYALSSLPHLVPQPRLGTATTPFSLPHLTSKAMAPVDPELNTHTSQAKNKSSSLLKGCSQVFVTVKRSLTGTAGQARLPRTNKTWSLLLTFPGPCVQTSWVGVRLPAWLHADSHEPSLLSLPV